MNRIESNRMKIDSESNVNQFFETNQFQIKSESFFKKKKNRINSEYGDHTNQTKSESNGVFFFCFFCESHRMQIELCLMNRTNSIFQIIK